MLNALFCRKVTLANRDYRSLPGFAAKWQLLAKLCPRLRKYEPVRGQRLDYDVAGEPQVVFVGTE